MCLFLKCHITGTSRWRPYQKKKKSYLNYFKGGGKKEETGTAEENEELREKNRNGEVKRSRETSTNKHIRSLLDVRRDLKREKAWGRDGGSGHGNWELVHKGLSRAAEQTAKEPQVTGGTSGAAGRAYWRARSYGCWRKKKNGCQTST